MKLDLNALSILALVASEGSFREAADRLGVSPSAVSQAVRKVEQSLGIAVLHRTTRSVSLTEAGEAMLNRVRPALNEIDAATNHIESWNHPAGVLRLAVSSIAETFLSGGLLASFREEFPDVKLDVLVTDEEFDIVASRFDAGVRLGEVIERDMIAVPVSGDQRQVVVASPDYLAAAGTPHHPRDLPRHRCVGWRPSPDVAPYRWEFTENGREFAVSVEPEFTTNDMSLMINLARKGAGLTIGMEQSFTAHLERGELRIVLEDFCPPIPGFFLFYPSRHHLPAKLSALRDHVQKWRSAQGR